jgi:subtilisin-like proprotein convertase family protein
MKTMKAQTLIGLLAVMIGVSVARAGLYTETFSGINTAIPDGNPVGVSFSESVGDIPGGSTVGGLTVDLSVSGGYNGNLYAYLVAPNGTLVMLLNQPGTTISNPFGYGGSGLNITLSDTAAGSIQTAPETPGAVFSGTFQAAGTLGSVSGSAADGTWTLYFADEVAGGGQATLSGWSLNITAVPEPANLALIIFGVGFIGVGVVRVSSNSRKAKFQSSPPVA